MNYRKHGAKLLGLLAVTALGVTALAASAQAATPGFLISLLPALLATFTADNDNEIGTLLVPKLNFEINCTAFTVDEGHIASSTHAKAVLLYTGCSTLELTLPEKKELPCHVAEPIKAEALILPAELTNGEPALLAEKIKALIRLWEPNAAKPLTNECTLPNDNTVTGELCLKVDNNDKVIILLLASEAIQNECKERKTLEALGEEVASGGFKDLLKYGGQDVFVDGRANVSLTNAHNGLDLGVCLI